MDTLHDRPDNLPDPQAATPYFCRRVFSRNVDEARQWYAADPPPGPLAA
jgi:hypothetical protein